MTYRRTRFSATYFDFPCGTEDILIVLIKRIEHSILLLCILYWIISANNAIPFLTAVAISVHELGHILTSHLLSCGLTQLKTEAGGLRLFGRLSYSSYKEEALIALGGPLFNLITAILSYILVGNGYFVQVSLSLALLNLLPIKSFDGNKILSAVLYQIFPWEIGESINSALSFIALFCIWCASVYVLIRSGRNVIPFLFSVLIFIKVITNGEKS